MKSVLSRFSFGQASPLTTALLLGGMMLFVIALSVLALSQQSLRLDEAQSLWQSARSPMGIFEFVAKDVHVPLYNVLLHLWQFTFGNGVETGRALSLIFYAATIPIVYFLGKESYGRSIGLFGALLVTVSPFLNWYGNEIKMYALLAMMTALNQLFFVRIFKGRGGSSWMGYALSAIVGMFTHYFFAFVLITQGIFFLLKFREFPAKSFRKFILTAVVVILALVPWLAYGYLSGAGSFFKPRLAAPTTVDLFNTYSQFIFGFQDDALNTLLVSLWPVSVVLGFIALRKRAGVPSETLYFFLAASVPIVAAFTISILISPFYLSRYLIVSLPALYIFLGWAFSTYTPRFSLVMRSLLVMGMVVTLAHQTVSAYTPIKEDYRSASDYISANVSSQDVVLLSAPFTVYPFEYYYTGRASLDTLPHWNRTEYGPTPPFSQEGMVKEVDKLKQTHQRAFLLLSVDQGYQEKVKSYFDSNFSRLEEKNFSRGLSLYVYKLRYDQP